MALLFGKADQPTATPLIPGVFPHGLNAILGGQMANQLPPFIQREVGAQPPAKVPLLPLNRPPQTKFSLVSISSVQASATTSHLAPRPSSELPQAPEPQHLSSFIAFHMCLSPLLNRVPKEFKCR